MKKIRVSLLILNIISIILIIGILVSSTIRNKKLMEGNEELISSNKELTKSMHIMKDENKKYKSDINILNKEKDEMISKLNESLTIDERMIKKIEEKGYSDYKYILKDLELHPELIPYKGVLGGTMSWWHDESYILNEKWVYGYFEDGHINGYALLEYKINDDKTISWLVLDSYLEGQED